MAETGAETGAETSVSETSGVVPDTRAVSPGAVSQSVRGCPDAVSEPPEIRAVVSEAAGVADTVGRVQRLHVVSMGRYGQGGVAVGGRGDAVTRGDAMTRGVGRGDAADVAMSVS